MIAWNSRYFCKRDGRILLHAQEARAGLCFSCQKALVAHIQPRSRKVKKAIRRGDFSQLSYHLHWFGLRIGQCEQITRPMVLDLAHHLQVRRFYGEC